MTTPAISRQSPQFSDLLRSWRKLNKLSQGELSMATGISQRHISFLESARSGPSRGMVIRLAEALDLPMREQNVLLAAAGFAPVHTQHRLDDNAMDQARKALSIMLEHHNPFGAMVVDGNWNLIMMNDANLRVFSQFVDPVNVWSAVGGERPNMMRVTLHPEGLRPYIENFDELARYFLNQIQRELANNPYNASARELLDEISAYPGIQALRDQEENLAISQPAQPFLPLQMRRDDLSLAFFTMVTTFGTPLDVTLQELRIETLFPADDSTEQYLRDLNAQQPRNAS